MGRKQQGLEQPRIHLGKGIRILRIAIDFFGHIFNGAVGSPTVHFHVFFRREARL